MHIESRTILGSELAKIVRGLAPEGVDVSDTDWLILTSHDRDIVNPENHTMHGA